MKFGYNLDNRSLNLKDTRPRFKTNRKIFSENRDYNQMIVRLN